MLKSLRVDTNVWPNSYIYFTGEKERNDQTEEMMETIQKESQGSDGEISMHALIGNIIDHIPGMIKKRAITILIDSASIHNFLDSKVAD